MFFLTEIQQRFQIKKIREQQALVQQWSKLALIIGSTIVLIASILVLAFS